MELTRTNKRENTTLDVFRVLACALVTTIHLPALFSSEAANVFFGEWFVRFAVPFFFVCTGFFFEKAENKGKTLKRMVWLLLLCYVLYLPAVLEGAQDVGGVISKLRWNLVIGYEHLWYISAALEGLLIWFLLEKIPVLSGLLRRLRVPVSVAVLLMGALLDEYYRVTDSQLLWAAGEFLANFGGPRNVVFMGLPLMLLGGAMARNEERIRRIPLWALIVLWAALRGLGFLECGWLYRQLGATITGDLTFFGCWPALCLVAFSLKYQLPMPEGAAKGLRRSTEYVYILHPIIAMLITRYLDLAPLPLWLATLAMCFALYFLLEKQFSLKKA